MKPSFLATIFAIMSGRGSSVAFQDGTSGPSGHQQSKLLLDAFSATLPNLLDRGATSGIPYVPRRSNGSIFKSTFGNVRRAWRSRHRPHIGNRQKARYQFRRENNIQGKALG